MRTNYVLIDLENVQPAELSLLDPKLFKVFVFVGSNQHKAPIDLAIALQPFGDRARYVKIAGAGPNALDFHIAFYIGNIAAQDPAAYFHIISKDRGFDPLLLHLKEREILAARWAQVRDIPLLKIAMATSAPERLEIIIKNLEHRAASRPRTVKTLSSTIGAIFHKELSSEEIDGLVKQLEKRGVIAVEGTKLTYHLPASL